MYVVVVSFGVLEQHVQQFEQALLRNANDSLTHEEGCLVFDVSKSETEASYFLYEVYSDEAAFELHLHARHFVEFSEATGPWVRSKAVRTFRLLGKASGKERPVRAE